MIFAGMLNQQQNMSYNSIKCHLMFSQKYFLFCRPYQTFQEASRAGDYDKDLPH